MRVFITAAVLFSAACSSSATRAPAIALTIPADNPSLAYVTVSGLTRDDLRALLDSDWNRDRWAALLHVSVKSGPSEPRGPAVAGLYRVSGDDVRFVPAFPFDPGREYTVVFDPAQLPTPSPGPSVVATVSRPADAPAPPTRVTELYPSGNELPENQLRMYIHFSAPMGLRGGLEHMALLDDAGREVRDPFLPLDAEFWNDDRTRYTVFFDPGRQKRGILPNRDMGRALRAGKRYTLVVRNTWLDGHGKPLAEEFRHEFRATAPDERPLDEATWRIAAPAGGTRDPLTVSFPEPLDHGLLLRAIGVERGAGDRGWTAVRGEDRVDANETRWSFVPAEPWAPGRYQLVVLSILEDRAGNRIGRAFEVDTFNRADSSAEPARIARPFTIAGK
jgi:hypothetical protein